MKEEQFLRYGVGDSVSEFREKMQEYKDDNITKPAS